MASDKIGTWLQACLTLKQSTDKQWKSVEERVVGMFGGVRGLIETCLKCPASFNQITLQSLTSILLSSHSKMTSPIKPELTSLYDDILSKICTFLDFSSLVQLEKTCLSLSINARKPQSCYELSGSTVQMLRLYGSTESLLSRFQFVKKIWIGAGFENFSEVNFSKLKEISFHDRWKKSPIEKLNMSRVTKAKCEVYSLFRDGAVNFTTCILRECNIEELQIFGEKMSLKWLSRVAEIHRGIKKLEIPLCIGDNRKLQESVPNANEYGIFDGEDVHYEEKEITNNDISNFCCTVPWKLKHLKLDMSYGLTGLMRLNMMVYAQRFHLHSLECPLECLYTRNLDNFDSNDIKMDQLKKLVIYQCSPHDKSIESLYAPNLQSMILLLLFSLN